MTFRRFEATRSGWAVSTVRSIRKSTNLSVDGKLNSSATPPSEWFICFW